MIRVIFAFFSTFVITVSVAQTTNSALTDSLFRVFPNPAINQFYATTQGKVYYAMIISSNGTIRQEASQYQIPSYSNQFGFGCSLAGCAGAYVPSNFICTLQRGSLEPGLYYLVLLDDLGHIYHTLIVFK